NTEKFFMKSDRILLIAIAILLLVISIGSFLLRKQSTDEDLINDYPETGSIAQTVAIDPPEEIPLTNPTIDDLDVSIVEGQAHIDYDVLGAETVNEEHTAYISLLISDGWTITKEEKFNDSHSVIEAKKGELEIRYSFTAFSRGVKVTVRGDNI
ncbi:hypothetical protein KC909_04140, partial [Candidatus Dojkabacteria bacterium]|nr:hypothetical protein [Candidatus Dojkabacteria bacterium]